MSGSPERNAVVSGERPLRICLVGPSLDILGGQAVQLERLRRRLADLPGLRVGFIAVNPRLPGPLRWLQRVKYLRTIVTSMAYGLRLLREVRRYDVVHAFSASYWSYVLAPLPAMVTGRLFGKAVILNYRSGEADDHLTRSRHTAVPSMRLAHEIVVPSPYLAGVFARHALHARPIANFVDTDSIPFRERRAPRPVFLSNRNLEPLYNVACTIRAFAAVQRELPDAALLVAGDGHERVALEELAGTLGLHHVRFLGRLSPEENARLYDEADIYLNSPNIDNMPNSVLEAFAAGLPVATTDAGGIPFIVRDGENGLVIPRGKHEALAAAALRLVREDGLALRLATAARAECLTKYVWPAVAAEWEETYRDVARRAHLLPEAEGASISPVAPV
jgi:glycosyltransferase involved in cell wall biosynthesis